MLGRHLQGVDFAAEDSWKGPTICGVLLWENLERQSWDLMVWAVEEQGEGSQHQSPNILMGDSTGVSGRPKTGHSNRSYSSQAV